jgi:hypothetical protein
MATETGRHRRHEWDVATFTSRDMALRTTAVRSHAMGVVVESQVGFDKFCRVSCRPFPVTIHTIVGVVGLLVALHAHVAPRDHQWDAGFRVSAAFSRCCDVTARKSHFVLGGTLLRSECLRNARMANRACYTFCSMRAMLKGALARLRLDAENPGARSKDKTER